MTALEILKTTRRRLHDINWIRGWGHSWSMGTCLVGGMRLAATGKEGAVPSTREIYVADRDDYREALIQMVLKRPDHVEEGGDPLGRTKALDGLPREELERYPTSALENTLVNFNDSRQGVRQVHDLLDEAIDELESQEQPKRIPQREGERKTEPAKEPVH